MKPTVLLLACMLAGAATLGSCSRDAHGDTTIYPSAHLTDTRAAVAAGVADSSAALRALMLATGADAATDSAVAHWGQSRAVKVFTPPADSVFPDVEAIAAQMGTVLGRARKAGLDIPGREYGAVVYGRPESILFVDSVMLIALNHYLGADYPGYAGWPDYMRRLKTPRMLPYDFAEATIATAYPYRRTDSSTLLSRMLYEGALTRAKLSVVPEATEAEALGYSAEELEWLYENEDKIWESIVSRRLLFDTTESMADRLTAPAPRVREVEPVSPGRVGRFIGYRIVDSYCRRHPEATAAFLLSPAFYDADSSLSEAAYSR